MPQSHDMFASFVQGLQMEREQAKDKEVQIRNILEDQYKKGMLGIAQNKQDMEIAQASGGEFKGGLDYRKAINMSEPRSMEETLANPVKPGQLGPEYNQPFASEQTQQLPLQYARGLENIAHPTYTTETDDKGNTIISTNKFGQLPKVVAPKTGTQNADLTPEGLSGAAELYKRTGNIPGLGIGGTKQKVEIINKAFEGGKADDTVNNLIQNAATYKANTSSMTNLRKQSDNITAFEKTAQLNLDKALSQSIKVGRTKVPIYNEWVNAGRRSVTGNPDLAAFDAYVRTVINEYARVTTTVTGGGITSDTARKEIENLFSTAQSPEQFKSVADALRIDMKNRINAYNAQFKEIQGRIGKKPQNQNSQEPAWGTDFDEVMGGK